MALTLSVAAPLVCADDAMQTDAMKSTAMKNDGMRSDMKAMDVNGDGLLSQTEYMASAKSSQAQWDAMAKNQDGMVDLKDPGTIKGKMADHP